MAKIMAVVEIPDAYSDREAAALLNVGRATIWRWVASGKLLTFRLGDRTLFPHSEIVRLQGLKNEGLPQPIPSGEP